MKLRIRDNSLRLRLTRTEVGRIQTFEPVTAKIQFAPNQVLGYSLEPSTEVEEVQAEFDSNQIRVLIPRQQALEWSTTDQVSVLSHQQIAPEKILILLVEKDFACLKPRRLQNEDESNLYQNPNMAHGHCT